MGHDASRILMGTTKKSFKVVDNIKGTIEAGLIVRLKSDGTPSIASADGSPLGISLGKDLGGAGRTSYVAAGRGVPVLLTASFTPVLGAQVFISDTTGKAGASGAGFTGMNAVYSSTKKIAMKEDGTEVADGVALIDMVGGL